MRNFDTCVSFETLTFLLEKFMIKIWSFVH